MTVTPLRVVTVLGMCLIINYIKFTAFIVKSILSRYISFTIFLFESE